MINFYNYYLLLEKIKKAAFFLRNPPTEVNNKDIRKLLNDNIIEVFFKRRVWPVKKATYQKSPYRRMLCTSNWKFIQNNSRLFNFKPPKSSRDPDFYTSRGLAIVWDLIVKGWRIVSLDDYDIINIYPIKTKEDQQKYINYYNNMLKREGRIKLHSKFNN